MRKLFVLLVLSLALSPVFAQFPMGGGGRPGGANAQNMNMGHFYGKVVDKSNKGIEAVTVQLVGNRFDTATKKMKEAILNTTITRANGEFSFENLPVFGNFKLRMSALGYKNLEQTIKFDIKMPQGGGGNASGGGQQGGGMSQMLGMVDKDLGNIKLQEDATNLGNVTVTATAATQLQLGIDRKVFTVDKNLSSTGQTAVEVMKNIPGLNVDIDGNVTMRNSAPTIFIDGRPTTLTLDQIPSDIIDKVEMITNPSAKYDASGGNAGILNIVLKKNKKTGYNGGIRAGIDSRGKPNLGGDLNLRQGKINLSLNANFNERKSISTGVLDRNNFAGNGFPASTVHNESNGTNMGQFGFVRGGLDYFIDNRNTISVAANYVRGSFNNDQSQRVDSTISGLYTSYNYIDALSTANFKNIGSQLSFKHNFAKNGHDITADVNYNSSNNDNLSNINTQTYYTNGGTKGLAVRQQTIGNGSNDFLTIQSDYENPITDDSKIEAGVRGAIRNFTNLSDQYFYDYNTSKFVLIPTISNKYKFNDQVYAAYGTYTFKVKRFNFQLGLRVESSSYTGTLLKQTGADSSSFSVKYPLSVFPSTFITYKLSDKEDFQLNYSRRVNRPNFFQLMPFPDYSDPQNINIGNPNLKPEFTDSYEISYSNNHARGANFLASLFFKYNTNLITRYTYQDVNPVSPTGAQAYFNTYINADHSYVGGLELTERLPITKWWDFTINANIFYSQLNVYVPKTPTSPEQNLTNDMWSWFAKTNNTFKIAKGLSVQLSGDYQAKSILPPNTGGGGRNFGGGGGMMFGGGPQSTSQGYNYPRYGWDLAIRKDWTWKNGQSGSLTLGMNDIFRTQLFKTYSESVYFTQINERRRDPQVLRLNFSYRFGKFDASLFKRKNTKADQSGGQDMMGGNQ